MRPTALIVLLGCGTACGQEARTDSLGDPLPERALVRMGTLRFLSPSVVKQMALTRDGRILITLGGFLTAWDAHTGRELWRESSNVTGIRVPTSYGLRLLAFEPDGQHFVTSGPQGSLIRWEASTGNRKQLPLRQLPGAQPGITGSCFSIDISSDGKLTAIGNAAGLRVLDENGGELYSMKIESPTVPGEERDRLRFGGPFAYGRFSPDATLLAWVTNDAPQSIHLADATTGQTLRTIECPHHVVRMDFSPNGKQLVATERDTAVRLYDVSTSKRVWENVFEVDKTIENYTSAIRFSPDGRLLAVCERNQRLDLLDARTGRQLGQFKEHSWNPWAVTFSADSRTLYSSGWGGTIHRWNVENVKQIPVPGAIRATSAVAAAADGKVLACADQSGRIHLLSATDGTELRVFGLPQTSIGYVAFSPNRKHLAAGGQSGAKVHVSLWDYHTGALIHRWDWDAGRDSLTRIEEIRFSSDGRLLAAAAFRQSLIHLWRVDTGRLVKALDHQSVYGIDFTPDGKTLVSAGWDRIVRFWNAESGELNKELAVADHVATENRDLRMYTVNCDPTGRLFATTHLGGGHVFLWDAEGLTKRNEIHVRGGFTFGSTCFSPDGLWFATGSRGGTIELRDPRTTEKVFEIQGHTDRIYTLDFGGDNLTLTSSSSGIGYHWTLRPDIDTSPPDQQWDQLNSETDSKRAYAAWWMMYDGGDASVRFLESKLSGVQTVLDLDRLTRAASGDAKEKRLKLLRARLQRDPACLRYVTACRAVSVLAHIRSDAALALLRELANGGSDLAPIAARDLRRISFPER